MKNIILTVSFLILYPLFTVAQCPVPDFTIPATTCLSEQIYPENTSTGATSYEWDFCSGDFELTPTTTSIGTSTSLNRGRSFRVVQNTDTTWTGFAIDQAANRLVRFEFGNNLQNTPTITNLGNPASSLSGAYDFIITMDSGNWYLLVTNTSANELLQLNFGSNLLNTNPIATSLGDFSELNTPNNLVLLNDQGTINLFITNGGNNSITKLDFGNSILNTPTSSSFAVLGTNNPRGIDIIKDCDRWVGLVTSYSNNKIFYLDFNNGLSQVPVTGEITFFTSYNFPATISTIYEGGNYYALIQSALGDLFKLSFGTTISDFTGTGQNLGDFGLKDNFASEWVSSGSDWFGFSIELSNASTPGAGNLIRYSFPVSCGASPAVSYTAYPQYEYTANGSYLVTLTAYDANGNLKSTTNSITVSTSTAPQLSTQITGNCLSNPLSFDGQQLSGNITAWNWDFGDGSGTSTLQNDTYSYAAAGTYRVKLSVTDANGCNNLYIDTASVYEEPIPAFTIPLGNLCMNNPIPFTNTSAGETGPVVSWTWDFNGEGSSTDKEPSFTFLTPGNKTVTLTSSIPGCANVTQQTISIEEAPTTAFSFNNACNGQTTAFVDSTTGNNLTAWNWDFGDGSNSTTQNPSHIYATPGKYAVTLTVGNSLGCNTSITDTVYNHAIPVVSFTNDLPCSSSPIQFTDQSMVQDANMVSWEWDFGDGTTASERNPQHLYGQTGDFTVKLKAYSQFGCVDSIESVITILQGPEVDFSWDKSCTNETTAFTDNTLTAGIPITNWNWLIDGAIIEDQNPQYNFTNTGTYMVQLSVTTNNLCSQTFSKDIIIEDPPATSFGYFESCTDDSVTFYDTTPANIATREWRIESVLVGSDSSLTSNLTPDNYLVSLVTTSSANCTGISQQNINITGVIKAAYTPSTNYGANPLTIQFNNQSSGTTDYFWDFDYAGGTSTESNPQFTYNDLGSYQVKLIAYGGQDCSDTTSQTIEVVELEHAVSIEAIIAQEDGKLNVILKNNGSATYQESNSKLLFTLDNGAEITENFEGYLYPQATKVFIPNFSLGSTGSSKILCVSLQYNEGQKSAILAKNCLNLNNQAVVTQAYPNPTRDNINLSVVLPTAGSVIITLIDRNGAVILHDSYEAAQQGLNEYTIDTTPYRAGLYIIKVEAGREIKEMKVVISH